MLGLGSTDIGLEVLGAGWQHSETLLQPVAGFPDLEELRVGLAGCNTGVGLADGEIRGVPIDGQAVPASGVHGGC